MRYYIEKFLKKHNLIYNIHDINHMYNLIKRKANYTYKYLMIYIDPKNHIILNCTVCDHLYYKSVNKEYLFFHIIPAIRSITIKRILS
jgi:hypothetical protein